MSVQSVGKGPSTAATTVEKESTKSLKYKQTQTVAGLAEIQKIAQANLEPRDAPGPWHNVNSRVISLRSAISAPNADYSTEIKQMDLSLERANAEEIIKAFENLSFQHQLQYFSKILKKLPTLKLNDISEPVVSAAAAASAEEAEPATPVVRNVKNPFTTLLPTLLNVVNHEEMSPRELDSFISCMLIDLKNHKLIPGLAGLNLVLDTLSILASKHEKTILFDLNQPNGKARIQKRFNQFLAYYATINEIAAKGVKQKNEIKIEHAKAKATYLGLAEDISRKKVNFTPADKEMHRRTLETLEKNKKELEGHMSTLEDKIKSFEAILSRSITIFDEKKETLEMKLWSAEVGNIYWSEKWPQTVRDYTKDGNFVIFQRFKPFASDPATMTLIISQLKKAVAHSRKTWEMYCSNVDEKPKKKQDFKQDLRAHYKLFNDLIELIVVLKNKLNNKKSNLANIKKSAVTKESAESLEKIIQVTPGSLVEIVDRQSVMIERKEKRAQDYEQEFKLLQNTIRSLEAELAISSKTYIEDNKITKDSLLYSREDYWCPIFIKNRDKFAKALAEEDETFAIKEYIHQKF